MKLSQYFSFGDPLGNSSQLVLSAVLIELIEVLLFQRFPDRQCWVFKEHHPLREVARCEVDDLFGGLVCLNRRL